jgi:DNA topoisomerase II
MDSTAPPPKKKATKKSASNAEDASNQYEKVTVCSYLMTLSSNNIYSQVSQREHVLLRPDTYIGSVSPTTEHMWTWNLEQNCMLFK